MKNKTTNARRLMPPGKTKNDERNPPHLLGAILGYVSGGHATLRSVVTIFVRFR